MKLRDGLLLASFAAVYLWLDVAVPWRHLPQGPGDFRNTYQAARALAGGASPYTVHGFDYPPLLAFLLAGPARLGEDGARVLWFCFGQASMLAAGWVTARWLGGDRTAWLAVAAVWALGGTVAENLFLGQVHPLLLLLLTGTLTLWTSRPRLAGALVGVAAALKLWPGVLLLPLALRRRWAALACGLALAALLVAGPLLLLAAAWPQPHLPTSSSYWMGNPAPLNFSLPALALRLAEPPAGPGELPHAWLAGNDPSSYEPGPRRGALGVAVGAATLLLGAAAVAWSTFRHSGGERAESFRVTALLAVALLASPISWYHYQLLQFPALALLAATFLRRRAWAALAGLAALAAGLTWTHRLGFGNYVEVFGWTAAAPVRLWTTTSLVPVLGLVLAGWLLVEARRPQASIS